MSLYCIGAVVQETDSMTAGEDLASGPAPAARFDLDSVVAIPRRFSAASSRRHLSIRQGNFPSPIIIFIKYALIGGP